MVPFFRKEDAAVMLKREMDFIGASLHNIVDSVSRLRLLDVLTLAVI